ncbi:hypothetical protein PAMP_003720 [Pampus punctatissimus]
MLTVTTTTISSLFGVPTREINQHLVQCVVTSAALSIEKILPFTIQVYFSPMEVTISDLSSDSFQCVTEANPHARAKDLSLTTIEATGWTTDYCLCTNVYS